MHALTIRCCSIVVFAILSLPLNSATVGADASQDDRIKTVQTYLNSLGYNAGVPDGILGPRTDAAIRAFQRDTGFPVDGMVTDRLVGAIYAAWLLQLHARIKALKGTHENAPGEPLQPESSQSD